VRAPPEQPYRACPEHAQFTRVRLVVLSFDSHLPAQRRVMQERVGRGTISLLSATAHMQEEQVSCCTMPRISANYSR